MNNGETTQHEGALLTVREVAQLLRVSANCVYELVGRGKLACYRIGAGRGVVRVSRADVDAYLATCRKGESGREPTVQLPRPRLKHLTL